MGRGQLWAPERPPRRPRALRIVRETRMTQTIVEEQVVKSRHRVKTYGEVFTPRHMVDRMLDLVREELETGPDFVDKTFLEPAAGDGNFLVAILHRKLHAIEKRYPREEWPEESLFALASIYGIELLEDNHRDAKEAMLAEFVRFHDEPRRPLRPGHEPATSRGLPHRHEHRPRQHPDRPGLARQTRSSSPGGTGSPKPRAWSSASRSRSPRCATTALRLHRSTTATRRAGSTGSTRR